MRASFRSFALAAAALLFVALAARAEESSFACSVQQGFNFEMDAQVTFGVLESLTIGDIAAPADIAVTIPGLGEKKRVVGVLSSIYWAGGYADPIQLSAQISEETRNKLAGVAHTTMSHADVVFTFAVYEYDPKAKAYYPAFHSGGRILKGVVAKQGGERLLTVGDESSEEVPSPRNYALAIGIMPQESEMQLHLAVSLTTTFAKKWGVAKE